jgi:hypothetical protein
LLLRAIVTATPIYYRRSRIYAVQAAFMRMSGREHGPAYHQRMICQLDVSARQTGLLYNLKDQALRSLIA